MATKAQKAWGCSLSFDGVTIGEVTSMNGSRTRNMIDVFSCDSAGEAVERLTSGLDEGVWTFGFVVQPGTAENYDVLNDKFLAAVKGSLVITGPIPTGLSAPKLTVQAIISSLSIPQFGSAREVRMGEVGFTTSGKVTYTDSSNLTATVSPSTTTSASPSSSAS